MFFQLGCAMIEIIHKKREAVAEHCRRLNVRRLDVFGSAANGTFDEDKSDIDFLVEFGEHEHINLFDRYFDLADSLEALFNRKVDLVTAEGAAKKPRFQANVEAEKEAVYAL